MHLSDGIDMVIDIGYDTGKSDRDQCYAKSYN